MNKKVLSRSLVTFGLALTGTLLCSCSDDSDSNAVAPLDPASSAEVSLESSSDMGTGIIPVQESSSSVTISDNTPVPESSSVTDIVPVVESSSSVVFPVVESSSSVVTPVVSSSSVVDNATYTYYGAELSGLDQFKYGKFEAYMKMVQIPGSVSSMFLYYDDSYRGGDYIWNEIDIEIIGKSDTIAQYNIITGTAEKKVTSESKPALGFHATEDFHLYALVWTPDYVAWEIDGVEVRRDVTGLAKGQVEFLTETQTLRFNLWASKSAGWTGKFTGEELAAGPQVQWIDYVRVYSYNEGTKDFTLSWQDDFDGTTLSDHWTTGNWDMENVTLAPWNVVVEDGYCKLLMTREAD